MKKYRGIIFIKCVIVFLVLSSHLYSGVNGVSKVSKAEQKFLKNIEKEKKKLVEIYRRELNKIGLGHSLYKEINDKLVNLDWFSGEKVLNGKLSHALNKEEKKSINKKIIYIRGGIKSYSSIEDAPHQAVLYKNLQSGEYIDLRTVPPFIRQRYVRNKEGFQKVIHK